MLKSFQRINPCLINYSVSLITFLTIGFLSLMQERYASKAKGASYVFGDFSCFTGQVSCAAAIIVSKETLFDIFILDQEGEISFEAQ